MSRIFVTGDTHGKYDIHKLTTKAFPIQKELTRDDFVIVAGDWGGVWDGASSDRDVQNWWKEKPFTCCWLDGNHENFDLLSFYPVEEWKGGKIHRIAENIIHLCRGQVYEISGRSFYVFGGAISTDRVWRKEGISWWPQEEPNDEEEREGFLNLQKHQDQVDYILTHDGPASVVSQIYAKERRDYMPNHISSAFDALARSIHFEHWYFGHHHEDLTIGRYTCCYQEVIEIM